MKSPYWWFFFYWFLGIFLFNPMILAGFNFLDAYLKP